MFIDTHTHIYLEKFDLDRDICITEAKALGVEKLLMPNIDLNSISQIDHCLDKYPDVCYPMLGLHPCSVNIEFASILDDIYSRIPDYRLVAIGEIGLDYYWSQEYIKSQKKAFITQIEWANKLKLPIVIHSRDSIDDCIEIVKRHKNEDLTGVFHCFTGSLNQANQIIEMGFYLGIGGVVTFKNSGLDKVVEQLPLDKLILETDAPYLAPHPHRGKRNEPKYIPLIAAKIAELKKVDIPELANISTKNALQLFQL